jgi:predicted signal transduction protein with EAL and GGDEF domain
VEALLRMSETGGELILPMSFIPVAERYDLMRTIDRWVVERAFTDFSASAKQRDDPSPAEFSINLSGHTLSSPDFADFMQEKFLEYGVPPQSIFFEITETAAIANVERARTLIETLRALGRALPARRFRQRAVFLQLPEALPGGRHQDRRPVREGHRQELPRLRAGGVDPQDRHQPRAADHRRST